MALEYRMRKVLPILGNLLSLGPIALLTYYTAEPNGTWWSALPKHGPLTRCDAMWQSHNAVSTVSFQLIHSLRLNSK